MPPFFSLCCLFNSLRTSSLCTSASRYSCTQIRLMLELHDTNLFQPPALALPFTSCFLRPRTAKSLMRTAEIVLFAFRLALTLPAPLCGYAPPVPMSGWASKPSVRLLFQRLWLWTLRARTCGQQWHSRQ